MTFESIVDTADTDPAAGRWFIVRGNEVLVAHGAGRAGVDHTTAASLDDLAAAHVLARVDGDVLWAVEVPAEQASPRGHRFCDLFSLHAVVDADDWLLAGRAVQIIEWARTHRFCGRCATPTEPVSGERSVRCPACGLVAYPRLSPAVITLVHRGEEVLLGRGRLFPQPMYSCLAGFVEPGESVEHAVRREVKEEVGVDLGDVRYVASQPWPFPNSLMLGFTAEWAGGDIVIDETELVDARWFPVHDLPSIPPPISIANQLITGWVAARHP